MKRVLGQAQAVAPSDSSVLILGESGVGKELIAARVHDLSRRRDGPLVKVNCASVPRELFESEFFGHVRGAFSGAARDRQGRFLLADGGTLFPDEVGEIPPPLQSKLLRVLQEGCFEAVGDDRTRKVNVRVIAATNRALEQEVEAGTFRRDLYYRLSVLPLNVPPLRERREDILPMARRFLENTSRRLSLAPRPLTAEGELSGFEGNVLSFAPGLKDNLDGADAVYNGINRSIDAYIEKQRISAPPPTVYVPVWAPEEETLSIDAAALGITAIVWCIGFRTDYAWVELPLFDANGHPIHRRGVTRLPGVYFLGLPWLHTWGSGRFSGVGSDAQHVVGKIHESLSAGSSAEGMELRALGS